MQLKRIMAATFFSPVSLCSTMPAFCASSMFDAPGTAFCLDEDARIFQLAPAKVFVHSKARRAEQHSQSKNNMERPGQIVSHIASKVSDFLFLMVGVIRFAPSCKTILSLFLGNKPGMPVVAVPQHSIHRSLNWPGLRFLYFHYLCAMPWFVRIFTLYLFVLGCLPCADFEHDMHVQQPVFKAAVSQVFGHQHACADPCSPICSCACCGCVTISVKAPVLESPLPTPSVKETQRSFFYQAPLSVAHIATLFRPPVNKLG